MPDILTEKKEGVRKYVLISIKGTHCRSLGKAGWWRGKPCFCSLESKTIVSKQVPRVKKENGSTIYK